MQLSLSSSKYDKEISMSVYGAKDIQIVKQDHILRTMEWSKHLPIMLGKVPSEPIMAS
jgi:hypothetical protein